MSSSNTNTPPMYVHVQETGTCLATNNAYLFIRGQRSTVIEWQSRIRPRSNSRARAPDDGRRVSVSRLVLKHPFSQSPSAQRAMSLEELDEDVLLQILLLVDVYTVLSISAVRFIQRLCP